VAEPVTAAPQEAQPPQASPEERLAELQSQLAAALADADKSRDEWLRARAEADNIRRRAQDDVAKAHRFGIESFAASLLPVRDSLEAALAVESPTIDSLREGVELTARQLAAAFAKSSLSEIAAAGEKFDPNRHQAISQAESDQEPNTVVTVLQKGYLLNERVLRPALVVVAKAKEAPPAA
jgi:molecular chaperone GrpE